MDAKEGLYSDVDLNSLIEGDDNDFREEFVTTLEGPDEKERASSVVTPCVTLDWLCLEHLLGRRLFATSDLCFVRKQG